MDEEDIEQVTRKKPAPIQKGYSSGASSISEGESPTKGHTRDASDLLRLESMKTDLLTGGSLNTNVVRMETPFGKPIESVYDGVHHGEILGSGISGVVRLVTHKGTGCKYAVKILDIGLVKSDAVLDQLRDEIFIMCQLDHPNIVRIEEVYESTNEIYIVQELCLGKNNRTSTAIRDLNVANWDYSSDAVRPSSRSNVFGLLDRVPHPFPLRGNDLVVYKEVISLIGLMSSRIITIRKYSAHSLSNKCCRLYDIFTQKVRAK